MAYQSFDGQTGDSRSSEKLARLKLPLDLRGKSVLDLGCNEGFFCIEAKRRGADRVVGLDHDPKAIDGARAHATDAGVDVEFLVGKMTDLPAGKFDYILLLSALHYIDEPAALLEQIRQHLTPNGILVLEVGIAPRPAGQTVGRTLRSIDERYFATEELLRRTWLRNYAVREVGSSVSQVGDPVPRTVFHCRGHQQTNVVMIIGDGGIGKTTLASQFGPSPVISTDMLFSPMRAPKQRLAPPQQLYDRVFEQTKSIWATWEKIKDQDGVPEYFAKVIADAIRHCAGGGIVVVEGFILKSLASLVEQDLGASYRCWQLSKMG